jgi:hypothetical protein
MQVGALPAGTVPPATVPAVIGRVSGLTLAPGRAGCVTATAAGRNALLTLGRTTAPVLLTLTRQAPGELYSHLTDGRAQVPGIPRAVALASRTRFLIAAAGVRATLALPAGRTGICGVAAPR